jgi:cellulase/cellobiase CelA1
VRLDQVNGRTHPSEWIDWNRYVDESSFATAFLGELVSGGFASDIATVPPARAERLSAAEAASVAGSVVPVRGG